MDSTVEYRIVEYESKYYLETRLVVVYRLFRGEQRIEKGDWHKFRKEGFDSIDAVIKYHEQEKEEVRLSQIEAAKYNRSRKPILTIEEAE